MEFLINAIIVFLILGLTYALTSEGLWGSALMFFNVLFAALIAFNFYEPLAKLIDSTGIGWGFSDTLCLMLLFSITTLILRMTTETIAPAQVRFPMPDLPCRPIALRPGRRLDHDGGDPPGIPLRPGPQSDFRGDQIRFQTAIRARAGPPIPGTLPARERGGLHAVFVERPARSLRRVRRTQ